MQDLSVGKATATGSDTFEVFDRCRSHYRALFQLTHTAFVKPKHPIMVKLMQQPLKIITLDGSADSMHPSLTRNDRVGVSRYRREEWMGW